MGDKSKQDLIVTGVGLGMSVSVALVARGRVDVLMSINDNVAMGNLAAEIVARSAARDAASDAGPTQASFDAMVRLVIDAHDEVRRLRSVDRG